MSSLPAYVCAVANLVAVVALATVLAPGTTLADDTTRAAYVREHLALWRIGWATWIAAAASLIWFYAWWRARVSGGSLALAIAVAGFAADLVAESLLIAVVPDRPELARPAFVLTGGLANGAYSVAGAALSLRTPALRGALVPWTAAVWGAGLALAAFAVLDVPVGIAGATAVLFALFLPWLLVVGRRLG